MKRVLCRLPNKVLRSLSLCVIVGLLGYTSCSKVDVRDGAEKVSYTVVGSVYDRDGVPIPSIDISTNHVTKLAKGFQTRSDSSGNYRLEITEAYTMEWLDVIFTDNNSGDGVEYGKLTVRINDIVNYSRFIHESQDFSVVELTINAILKPL